MDVVICGAGQVGTYAAEALTAAGHNITVIDQKRERLEAIEEQMDVRTLTGNCATAGILLDAGANSDNCAVVAATEHDELNLLTASVACGLGAGRTVARVHHSPFFNKDLFDYGRHLGIDRLICPEYATAQTVTSVLCNPSATAIANYASGLIEMQEFAVTPGATAIGKTVVELRMPAGVRLAAVRRGNAAFLPLATTEFYDGDSVILVGNREVFEEGRRLFQREEVRRRRVVVMGGSAMGVWLCRAMRDRPFSIRLFETDRRRAEALAEKLDWVTVVHADPTDASVFDEERIGEADAFIGLSEDDEHNILGCAWAKSAGVDQVLAVVQRPRYVPLMGRVGIDHAFSPRIIAVGQIERHLNTAPLVLRASLAEGVIDMYRVIVAPGAEVVGQSLKQLR